MILIQTYFANGDFDFHNEMALLSRVTTAMLSAMLLQ